MNPDRVPVIVAIGELTDRPEDPRDAREPIALMAEAARLADQDGGGGWLKRADSVDVVHQASWRYEATAARLCAALGIAPARAVYGSYGGESPVRFLHEAAARIASGESAVALIVAGEAQHARSRAAREGWTPRWTPIAETEENPFDARGAIDPLAMAHGVVAPAHVYPLFENAWGAAHALTPAENLAQSAALWARYATVAAKNPFAWRTDAPEANAIARPSPDNRWIAWPYTKAMVANPNVNQGAAVILTSLAEARRAGIADERLAHIHGGAWASEPRNWLRRDRFDHSVAQEAVLRRAIELSEGGFDAVELYSCFPVVPKMAGDVLGPAALAHPTMAGGLSFFGGPLNGYMLHAATAMVRAMRRGDASTGLLYGQGEFVTKHHALVLGRIPGEGGLASGGDEQGVADALRGLAPLARDVEGEAAIETFTVVFDAKGQPSFGVVVARGEEGWRTLARTEDAEAIVRLFDPDPIGTAGRVLMRDDGRAEWVFS